MSKSAILRMAPIILGAALLGGCGGSAAEPTPKPKPVGKPEIPLKPEHKDAFMAMIKDKSNARFPDLDDAKFKEMFRAKIKTYAQMVAVLGEPDEVKLVNDKLSDKDIRPMNSNMRMAVYYNLIYDKNFVSSYYFWTGTTNAIQPLKEVKDSDVSFYGPMNAVYFANE